LKNFLKNRKEIILWLAEKRRKKAVEKVVRNVR